MNYTANFILNTPIRNRKTDTRFPAKFEDLIINDFKTPRWWAPVKIFDFHHEREKKFRNDIMVS